MNESIQDRIIDALLAALKPIARALLQAGISYKEFSEVAKLAFVEVASEEFGIRGRPTNISRVAVITGVSRKEVGKIRAAEYPTLAKKTKGTPAGEVLHRWHTEAKYLDESKSPIVLGLDDPDVSFKELVDSVVGDIPVGAMKAELLRVGAIEELANGKIRVIKRHFVPARIDDRLLHGLDTAIHYLASTVAYNSNPNRASEARFERVVSSVNISLEEFDQVRESSHEKLEAFTVEYDDFLSGLESTTGLNEGQGEIGMGVYFFQKTS